MIEDFVYNLFTLISMGSDPTDLNLFTPRVFIQKGKESFDTGNPLDVLRTYVSEGCGSFEFRPKVKEVFEETSGVTIVVISFEAPAECSLTMLIQRIDNKLSAFCLILP